MLLFSVKLSVQGKMKTRRSNYVLRLLIKLLVFIHKILCLYLFLLPFGKKNFIKRGRKVYGVIESLIHLLDNKEGFYVRRYFNKQTELESMRYLILGWSNILWA
jgi:hypothetical protein